MFVVDKHLCKICCAIKDTVAKSLEFLVVKGSGFFMWDILLSMLKDCMKAVNHNLITKDIILRTEYNKRHRNVQQCSRFLLRLSGSSWLSTYFIMVKYQVPSVVTWMGDGVLTLCPIRKPSSPSPNYLDISGLEMLVIVTDHNPTWKHRETGHPTSSHPEKKAIGSHSQPTFHKKHCLCSFGKKKRGISGSVGPSFPEAPGTKGTYSSTSSISIKGKAPPSSTSFKDPQMK